MEFPDNGFVQMFSSPLGINITEAIYTCDTGYKLIGENTRICQPNGNWTGSVPTCGEGQIPIGYIGITIVPGGVKLKCIYSTKHSDSNVYTDCLQLIVIVIVYTVCDAAMY